MNRSYTYAMKTLSSGSFPSMRVRAELGEFWIEDDNLKLLDGPFSSREAAESWRSRALNRAMNMTRAKANKVPAVESVAPKYDRMGRKIP